LPYLLGFELLAFWIGDIRNRGIILDLFLVRGMSEHADVITPYDVRPVSLEPYSKLGVLVSVRELFGELVFFIPCCLIFLLLRIFGWKPDV
jgi:hypothetical protein